MQIIRIVKRIEIMQVSEDSGCVPLLTLRHPVKHYAKQPIDAMSIPV